jgi:hypothetical protein
LIKWDLASGNGLAGHTQLLAKTDAHKFVGDIMVPMLIMTLTPGKMASLDGSDSQ